ncbi:MAG: 4Fe-4S binding protein, partial [Chloroflexia bacterium]
MAMTGILLERVPHVEAAICRACALCVARRACRTRALVQIDPGEVPAVDPALCRGCHRCVLACPFGAITA